jgi:hypothetical protein
MGGGLVDSAVLESPASPSEQIPAVELCSWDHKPYGVVSLLDMLKRYAFSFYDVACRLESLRSSARVYEDGTTKIYEHHLKELLACLPEMRAECDKLALVNTSNLTSHLESEVTRKGKDYPYSVLLNALNTLGFSFSGELRKRLFFGIEDDKSKYFQRDDLLGASVTAAFPSCVTEIRDAGNCYALEQYEATAFHSMRILERGLHSLAKKFGVDFSHTNWHNVIQEVEKKIRNMDSTFGADWKEQQKFCSQAATHFMFLKEGWRNHVMHVRDVPYDEGRALSVLGHVREFTQALAEGGLKE